ncbi:multiple chloroplast division site 1 [Raphanus sativus]|uniref:Protein MULTIPLE CHLOROPLAST DIVISION SITE 1 n=1 Tax=Raphanus sativus TaxID=3726 RepID=A0A6J0JPR2_RAPSA|nr:protein MULTIPLE CHLOROPLAST DIVISION SITE 1 [Raphanus sativus]KAJ4916278.1 multiple chloroplast division site 1 [Raphanus sativus]
MASINSLQFHSLCNLQSSIGRSKLQIPSSLLVFRRRHISLQVQTNQRFVCKSIADDSSAPDDEETQNDDDNEEEEEEEVATTPSNNNTATESETPMISRFRTMVTTIANDSETSISRFRSMVTTLPPVVFLMNKSSGKNSVWIGISIVATLLLASLRAYAVRKSRDNNNRPPGSVADLVRRGQLRSGDRRGISKTLNYEDPFNNPFVKLGKGSSTVEMCGKVYKLAPVTLTEKEQSVHQKRRSRAYQWKRPTVFLKEGDSVPPDVDPDTVRWIPANHPFATTVSDIDQDLAQNNVYQKQGVPFRIRAEHEAMQKKLEALQNEEKLNSLGIDSQNARDFQRPYKFSGQLEEDHNVQENHTGDSSSEETQ